jgi:hypothetical protein
VRNGPLGLSGEEWPFQSAGCGSSSVVAGGLLGLLAVLGCGRSSLVGGGL